jgi:hypothetical protein
MSDGMLKPMLLTFAAAAGISFVYWLVFLIRQNKQKDAEIVAKDTEIQYTKLKGEIDDSSLLDVIRRNNQRNDKRKQ